MALFFLLRIIIIVGVGERHHPFYREMSEYEPVTDRTEDRTCLASSSMVLVDDHFDPPSTWRDEPVGAVVKITQLFSLGTLLLTC